jgi:site-specific recombinase
MHDIIIGIILIFLSFGLVFGLALRSRNIINTMALKKNSDPDQKKREL